MSLYFEADIEQAIHKLLISCIEEDPRLAALVGVPIYPYFGTEEKKKPYICCELDTIRLEDQEKSQFTGKKDHWIIEGGFRVVTAAKDGAEHHAEIASAVRCFLFAPWDWDASLLGACPDLPHKIHQICPTSALKQVDSDDNCLVSVHNLEISITINTR